MIVEKPTWLRHEGLQIFSIDVQPGGLRFATAGGDHKVRIWDMKSLSFRDADPISTTSKLLATLRDHFGSVNCVRWAKSGRLIASGSDDQIILIHERRPGSGTTEFGSGEPPDVENWKVCMTLRGHTADVVDLCWSPEDSLLASCSLDNTVHIWNMNNGLHVAVLKGHTSLVKGVAWDPIGSFLASQSDDKSLIIWRTSDWSMVKKITGHWDKSVGSTFFRRLAWSPCGHFITTTNGFQKPRHSAPLLERGDWTCSFDFLGHNAPVVAVRFNNALFRKQPSRRGSEPSESLEIDGGVQNARTIGGLKSSSKESLPYNVLAMGSQDCQVTVWTTTSPRPVFVGKHFFSQSVVDLSWSLDGYSLFCCSLDGTVAAFHFEVKELGYKLSDAEMDELKRNRYGDIRGIQTTLAENPAQLALEAAATKQIGGTDAGIIEEPTIGGKLASACVGGSNANSTSGVPAPAAGIANGVSSNASGKLLQSKISSPVKQREYRRPDGRRRIIPEAVGPQIQNENTANGSHYARIDLDLPIPSQRQEPHTLKPIDARINEKKRIVVSDIEKGGKSTKRAKGNLVDSQADATARANASISVTFQASIVSGHADESIDIETTFDDNAKGLLSIIVHNDDVSTSGLPTCLETKSLPSKVGAIGMEGRVDASDTKLVCSRGGEILWCDRLVGKVTVLAGNSKFWAAGCMTGGLQIYTKAGRRALPLLQVGSAPAFIDCDRDWKLLTLTRHGLLYLWDLVKPACILRESVAPLFHLTDSAPVKSGKIKVVSARLSDSGAPLVVLANRYAFLFHSNMRCWLRVVDDSFAASSFSSSLPGSISIEGGELTRLQTEAVDAASKTLEISRLLSDDENITRAHLETLMASALSLQSADEYKRYLLAYARYLAREDDELRLRELCEELLGPPILNKADLREDTSVSVGQRENWSPTILSMKKHELLKTYIFPAMASNRRLQRLLSEFLDLLTEFESRHFQPISEP